jgi:hypothetical protein
MARASSAGRRFTVDRAWPFGARHRLTGADRQTARATRDSQAAAHRAGRQPECAIREGLILPIGRLRDDEHRDPNVHRAQLIEENDGGLGANKPGRLARRSTPTVMRPTPVQVSSQRCRSCSSGSVAGSRRKPSAARRRLPRASRLGLLTVIGLIEGHWLDPVVCGTGRATSRVCSGPLLGSKGLCCVAVPRRLLLADDNIDGLQWHSPLLSPAIRRMLAAPASSSTAHPARSAAASPAPGEAGL